MLRMGKYNYLRSGIRSSEIQLIPNQNNHSEINMAINKIVTEKYKDTTKNLTKKQYAMLACRQDVKSALFISSCRLYDKAKKTSIQLEFDMEWTHRQSYLYKTFVVDELNLSAISDNLVPIFVTITLPSRYHPTSVYYDGFSFEDGYKELVSFFRHLQDNFRHERKRVSFKYFRVCEPHKSFVPHFHAILWIPKNTVESFRNHHSNTVKLFNFSNLGQDLKVLDTAKHAVTYLMKYVQKTLEGIAYVRGWKMRHGIRLVSSSRSSIPAVIFKKISAFVKFDKESPLTYLQQIKEVASINVRIFDINKNIIKDNIDLVNSKTRYSCYLEKERIEVFKSVPSAYSLEFKKATHYNYKSFYKYKVLSLSIVDLDTFETVYDSTNYRLLRENEFIDFEEFEVGENGVISEEIMHYRDDGSTFSTEVIDYVE